MNSTNSQCRSILNFTEMTSSLTITSSVYPVSLSWSLSFIFIQLVHRSYSRSIGIETLPIYVEWSTKKKRISLDQSTDNIFLSLSLCRSTFLLYWKLAEFIVHTYSIHLWFCATYAAKWKHGSNRGTKKRTSSHTYFFCAYKRLRLLVSVSLFSLSLLIWKSVFNQLFF